MPSEIRTARFAELCRAIFGVRGHAGGVQCIDDVFPHLNINDPDPSLAFLRGERGWAGFADTAAGGAGRYSIVHFWNPVGSGRIVTTTSFSAEKAASGWLRLGIVRDPAAAFTAVRSTGESMAPLDGRQGYHTTGPLNFRPLSACGFFSLDDGAVPTTGARYWYTAGTLRGQAGEGPWVLVPGTGLAVVDETANELLRIYMGWVERECTEDELMR